jgi:hypothetical protein
VNWIWYNTDMKHIDTGLEKQLKAAISKSDMNRAAIARASKVSEAQLSYFMADKRTLTLTAAGKVASVLRLKLQPIKAKKKRVKKWT